MTAINMFCQPRARAGYIVADCAVLDFDGVYREACSKVAISTGRFPFAIGMTGNIHPHIVVKALGETGFTSIKQLIKHLPATMRRAMEAGRHRLNGRLPMLALKGIAWDFANKRPSGFFISSDEAVMPGTDPFVYYETDWNFNQLDGQEDPSDLFGRDIDPTDPQQFDAEIDGLRVIETQRQAGAKGIMPGMEHVRHTIGAAAHL